MIELRIYNDIEEAFYYKKVEIYDLEHALTTNPEYKDKIFKEIENY